MTRVLVVDDSQSFRTLLTIVLSRLAAVEVIGHAQSCAEARALIGASKPDVVILDLHLPDGSGLDVLRDVKNGPCAPLVVMCTSDADPQCRSTCVRAGADFFISKLTDVSRWEQLFSALLGTPCD